MKKEIINDNLKAFDGKIKIIAADFRNWRIKHAACEIRKIMFADDGMTTYKCLSCNEVYMFNEKK